MNKKLKSGYNQVKLAESSSRHIARKPSRAMKTLDKFGRKSAMIWSHTMVKTTTVCYKSNFWELDRLTDTKPTTVIKKLKAHLGTGSPDSLSLRPSVCFLGVKELHQDLEY